MCQAIDNNHAMSLRVENAAGFATWLVIRLCGSKTLPNQEGPRG